MTITQSKKNFSQARKILVGGVNSPVRSFLGVGGDPLIMARGQGSHLFDIDGNRYTDYCLSWGALILGHKPAAVVKSLKTSISFGSSFGTTTKPEIEIAQFIGKYIPSIDLLRFVNSGTEATMSAVRLARGFTGRTKIIKFNGCYHGHFDDFMTCQGITAAHMKDTFSLPYNNTQELAQVIERHHKDIAAVIVEPVAGNMGVVVPDKAFLKTMRELTAKNGIVLIFDEVMTGFRTNLGGAQADFGITPDLTCLGKIIGGGFPVGAYGGRTDIMRHLAPLGKVYQAGTFAGNPLVMRAGLAVLKNLTPAVYKDLNRNCDDLVQKVPAHLVNYKSMISFRFSSFSKAVYSRLFKHLLKEEIYMPPAELESFFVSSRHSAGDLNRLASTITEFFAKEKGSPYADR